MSSALLFFVPLGKFGHLKTGIDELVHFDS